MIRRATLGDVDAVLELYRKCMTELTTLGGYPVEDDSAYWEPARMSIANIVESPNERCVLAVDVGGAVVGYEIAYIFDLEPPYKPMRLMRSVSTYIEPEHRGGKLAKDLVQTAIDWAKERGATKLEAFTLMDNRSRLLMERSGFKVGGYELRRDA